jgi:hypothetical protein
LKGDEGSSNFGNPIPLGEIGSIRVLLAQMRNAYLPPPASLPIESQTASISEEGNGYSDDDLATQVPQTTALCARKKRAMKGSAPGQFEGPKAELIALLGRQKPCVLDAHAGSARREQQSLAHTSTNIPTQIAENATIDTNNRRKLAEPPSTDERKRFPITTDTSCNYSRNQLFSKRFNLEKDIEISTYPALIDESGIKCFSNDSEKENYYEPPPDNTSANVVASSGKTTAKTGNQMTSNHTWLSPMTYRLPDENPWISLTRIPRKLVTIPKDQLELLENDNSWVTSMKDDETYCVNMPSGVPHRLERFHRRQSAVIENNIGASIETTYTNGHNDAEGRSLSKDSVQEGVWQQNLKSPSKSSPLTVKVCTEDSEVRMLKNNSTTTQIEGHDLEAVEAISWPPTPRQSSIDPVQERTTAAAPTSPFQQPLQSGTINQSGAFMEDTAVIIDSSPGTESRHSKDRVSLSPLRDMNPSKSQSDNARHTFASVLNSFPPSSGYSLEDNIEQALPHALDDVAEPSQEASIWDEPAAIRTTPFTKPKSCAVLQIERSPCDLPPHILLSLPYIRTRSLHEGAAISAPGTNAQNISSDPVIPATLSGDITSYDCVSVDNSSKDLQGYRYNESHNVDRAEINVPGNINVLVPASSAIINVEEQLFPTAVMHLSPPQGIPQTAESLTTETSTKRRRLNNSTALTFSQNEYRTDTAEMARAARRQFIEDLKIPKPKGELHAGKTAISIPPISMSQLIFEELERGQVESEFSPNLAHPAPSSEASRNNSFETRNNCFVASQCEPGVATTRSIRETTQPELCSSDRSAAVMIASQVEVQSPISNVFERFIAQYPQYRQSVKRFIGACVYIDWLLQQKMAPHPYLWDDFTRVYSGEYSAYVEEKLKSDQPRKTGLEYYNTEIGIPVFTKGILTPGSINEAISLDFALTKKIRSMFQRKSSAQAASKTTPFVSRAEISENGRNASIKSGKTRPLDVYNPSHGGIRNDLGPSVSDASPGSPILGDGPGTVVTQAAGESSGESPVFVPKQVPGQISNIKRQLRRTASLPAGAISSLDTTPSVQDLAQMPTFLPQPINMPPCLASRVSPISRKVAETYIPRRERKHQWSGIRGRFSLPANVIGFNNPSDSAKPSMKADRCSK